MIGLVYVHQRRDVLHDGGRQALGDRVPMSFHEHEGDDGLQDHHWRDDDEQRARIKPLRQDAVEPVAEPVPRADHPAGGRAQRGNSGIEAGHWVITSR
jgi:hypothetical protein